MGENGDLRRHLATAARLDEPLSRAVAEILPKVAQCCFGKASPPDFDDIFRCVEQVHPGFLYLAWRNHDGRHHCSIAMDEQDLDRHSWLGMGSSPVLALTAALVASLGRGPHD